MFKKYVDPALKKRRNAFIKAVDQSVGEDYTESDALLAFASTALRSVEYGCSEYESEQWQRAIVSAAKTTPLGWRDILPILETGRLTPTHVVLLRILCDPMGTHERFAIAIPCNMALGSVVTRAVNAVIDQPIKTEDLSRLWRRLVDLGLAWMPNALGPENTQSLSDFSTDLGRDFLRIICRDEPPIAPKVKPVAEKPAKIKTPLAWLAESEPERYEFAGNLM